MSFRIFEEEPLASGLDAAAPVSVAVVEFNVSGVGEREMLITCSMPVRQTASMTSPLKKSMNMDLSWMNRGWESNRSDAK